MKKNKDPRLEQPQVELNEPSFVLRGDDPQAADLVRLWAEGRDFLHGSSDPTIEAARRTADAMEEWCLRQHGENFVTAVSLLPFELLAAELRRRGARVTPGMYADDLDDREARNI